VDSPTKRQKRPRGTREGKAGRADPKPRERFSETGMFRLVGRENGMSYVWASVGNRETGVSHYRAMGYKAVQTTGGGVRWASDPEQPEGQEIQVKDMLLMQIPTKRLNEIREHGLDGDSGRAQAEAVYDQLFRAVDSRNVKVRPQDQRLGQGLTGFQEAG
jgi:hypothetical protein